MFAACLFSPSLFFDLIPGSQYLGGPNWEHRLLVILFIFSLLQALDV